jgi:DNA-binding IscR family transcriptional regulator
LLRRGGIVAALRGRNGGYELAAAPVAVSMAAILRAVSSESPPHHHCLDTGPSGEPCPRSGDCGLRSVWRHLQRQVTHILEQTSLADLLQQEREVDGHVDQIWPLASVEVSEETENGLWSAGITEGVEYR